MAVRVPVSPSASLETLNALERERWRADVLWRDFLIALIVGCAGLVLVVGTLPRALVVGWVLAGLGGGVAAATLMLLWLSHRRARRLWGEYVRTRLRSPHG